MRRIWIAAAAILAGGGNADAWQISRDKDPMTDQVTAVIGEVGKSKSGLPVGMAFKCWKGASIDIRLITPVPYRDDGDYKAIIHVEMRADAQPPHALDLKIYEHEGSVALGGFINDPALNFKGSDIASALAIVQSAQKKVLVRFNGIVYAFSAANGRASVQGLLDHCGLKLD